MARRSSPALELRARAAARGARRRRGIGAAIFDVDGVLTDGRVYIGEQGETFKAFSTLDGQGLKLLAQGGIVPIVVTGRDSPAVRRRVADLGIVHAAYGAADKLAAASSACRRASASTGARSPRSATTGPTCRCCARCASPARRPAPTSRCGPRRTTSPRQPAGYGAAREFCDLLLVAAGRYAEPAARPLCALDGAR